MFFAHEDSYVIQPFVAYTDGAESVLVECGAGCTLDLRRTITRGTFSWTSDSEQEAGCARMVLGAESKLLTCAQSG